MHSKILLEILRGVAEPIPIKEAAERLRDRLVEERSDVFAEFDLVIFETMVIDCEDSGEVIIDHDRKTVILSPEWRNP